MTPFAVYLAAVCRLYILTVLASAVVGKATGWRTFRESMTGQFGFSERAAGMAALAVLGAEAAILAAVALTARVGMAGALIMFALFWIMILVALVRRTDFACNCFGGAGRPVSRLDLVRNGTFVGACAFSLLAPSAAELHPSAWLLLLGVALIAFLVLTNLDEIAAAAR